MPIVPVNDRVRGRHIISVDTGPSILLGQLIRLDVHLLARRTTDAT